MAVHSEMVSGAGEDREALLDAPPTPVAPVRGRGERVDWLGLRREIPAFAYRLLGLAGFALALAGWAWWSHLESTNPIFLPRPETVARAAGRLLVDENLWLDLKLSFFRVTAGFLLAAVIALPLGILMGAFKVFEGLLQPLTDFIRYIPVPALIPIFMVLFGIDELSKVMLIWVGTFFQLLLMVSDEVRRVPYDLLQVSYTLGASRGEVLRRVIWPAARPGVFDALRLCNGWAWTYVVVAELVAANEGLGYRILKFSRYLQTPQIWVYIFFLGLLGLGLDFAFRLANRRLFHWAGTGKR